MVNVHTRDDTRKVYMPLLTILGGDAHFKISGALARERGPSRYELSPAPIARIIETLLSSQHCQSVFCLHVFCSYLCYATDRFLVTQVSS